MWFDYGLASVASVADRMCRRFLRIGLYSDVADIWNDDVPYVDENARTIPKGRAKKQLLTIMGWVVGVVLNLMGSVCINGGTNLMVSRRFQSF